MKVTEFDAEIKEELSRNYRRLVTHDLKNALAVTMTAAQLAELAAEDEKTKSHAAGITASVKKMDSSSNFWDDVSNEELKIGLGGLRIALSGARSYPDLIEFSSDDDEITSYTRIIRPELDRVQACVEDYSKLERFSQSEGIGYKEMKLAYLLEDARDVYQNKFRHRGISVEMDVPDDAKVLTTPLAERAVATLFQNASHYADDNSTIKVNAFADDGTYEVRVTTYGMPIDKEKRDRLFKGKVDSTNGHGVGLDTSKKIIDVSGNLYLAKAGDDPKETTFVLEFHNAAETE